MGHANLENISKFFINTLKVQRTLSIKDCTNRLVEAGEVVHASEGEYDEPYMLVMALEEVVEHFAMGCNPPVIEAVPTDDPAWHLYEAWMNDNIEDWDLDEFDLFDSIKWRLTPSWENRLGEVGHLRHVGN